GSIGLGPVPAPGQEDPDSVNAAQKHATPIAGASIVHNADSFSMIRGGRLDYSVLGGLQVSSGGDIANWKVPGQKGGGGVGGAMDLAVGARNVLV
ncbi:CoA-transferase, partial [Klebsiella pneumoniae]|uniref:CoA-transferase n=1 Tax=Klebsiella pneumoniae TaxID=573 RepID=UPI0012892022